MKKISFGGYKPSILQPQLTMAATRLQISGNEKTAIMKEQLRDIKNILGEDQPMPEKARIKTEMLIRDFDTVEAYELLQLNCELLSERIQSIHHSKKCPPDLVSCVSTIIWASTIVNIPELIALRKQFRCKFGKGFDSNAMKNVGGVVNERVEAKLSVQPPSAHLVQTYLKKIADGRNLGRNPKASTSTTPDAPSKSTTNDLMLSPDPPSILPLPKLKGSFKPVEAIEVNYAEPVDVQRAEPDKYADYAMPVLIEEESASLSTSKADGTSQRTFKVTCLIAAACRVYNYVPKRISDCMSVMLLTNLIWIFVMFSDNGSTFPMREIFFLVLLYFIIMAGSVVWIVTDADEPAPSESDDEERLVILPLKTDHDLYLSGHREDSGRTVVTADITRASQAPSAATRHDPPAFQAMSLQHGCPSFTTMPNRVLSALTDQHWEKLVKMGSTMSVLGPKVKELANANEHRAPHGHILAQMTELSIQLTDFLITIRREVTTSDSNFGTPSKGCVEGLYNCARTTATFETAAKNTSSTQTSQITPPCHLVSLPDTDTPPYPNENADKNNAFDVNLHGLDNCMLDDFVETFSGQGRGLDETVGEILYKEFADKEKEDKKETPKPPKKRKPRVLDLAEVAIKTDGDVLFGRGGAINKHPGNKRFRLRAEELWPLFRQSTKQIKEEIANRLVDEVKKNGHRFLEKGEDGKWHEVLTGENTKASQTFRDLHKHSAKSSQALSDLRKHSAK